MDDTLDLYDMMLDNLESWYVTIEGSAILIDTMSEDFALLDC